MPLIITALVVGMSTTPVTYEPPLVTPMEVSPIETLQKHVDEKIVPTPPKPTVLASISKVAKETGVSSSTLYNVAKSEGNLQADPEGHNDGGRACGVVQIHAKEWNMDCDELKENPEIGLRFLAKHIKADTAWKYWTSMNCYSYLKYALKIPLPKMAEIIPNTNVPYKGMVAVFNYSGVKHVAYVSSVGETTFTIKEANFKAGLIATRTIHKTDKFLLGFYDLGV